MGLGAGSNFPRWENLMSVEWLAANDAAEGAVEMHAAAGMALTGLEKARLFREIEMDIAVGATELRASHVGWIRKWPELGKLSIGRDKSTLLLLAARYDCATIVEDLLATGCCNARAVDDDGYSALMFAALAREEDVGERVARALIPHCSLSSWNPKRGPGGAGDVSLAISEGNLKIAKMLADARGGAAVSKEGPIWRDAFGQNWLHFALMSQKPEAALDWALSLPSARIMFDAQNNAGQTPWQMALSRAQRHPEAVEKLLAARANWERDDLLLATPISEGRSSGKPRARL